MILKLFQTVIATWYSRVVTIPSVDIMCDFDIFDLIINNAYKQALRLSDKTYTKGTLQFGERNTVSESTEAHLTSQYVGLAVRQRDARSWAAWEPDTPPTAEQGKLFGNSGYIRLRCLLSLETCIRSITRQGGLPEPRCDGATKT